MSALQCLCISTHYPLRKLDGKTYVDFVGKVFASVQFNSGDIVGSFSQVFASLYEN